ncbi:hypothetical protein HN51_071652 [Arachis hypogaea]
MARSSLRQHHRPSRGTQSQHPAQLALHGVECILILDTTRLFKLLDLRSNFLQGEVHEMLSRIQNLQSLVLQGNQLSGELPDSLGKLEHLEVLDLSNNTITGPTPASLANLSSLRTLNLGHNRLNGTKTSIGDVEAIFIC